MRHLCLIAALLIGAPGAARAQSDAGPADAGVAADAGTGAIVIPDHMVPRPDAPDAVAGVANGSVQVGRAFSLFVTITHDAGVEVNVPSAILGGGAFEEVRRTYTDSTAPDGRKVREYEIQLMAWLVGEHMLPPVEVVYVVRGEAHKTQTAPVPLTVLGVIGDGEESLRDIAPPVALERTDYTLLYVGVAVLGGLVLGVVVLLIARRRRPRSRRARARRSEPSLPLAPDARALARLEALEASGMLDNEDRKPAYLELSEIVREYLGSRFRFAALDSTTSEIKAHLGARPDGAPAMEILGHWLDEVDLVKYASYQPTDDEAAAALADARALVARCVDTPVADEVPEAPIASLEASPAPPVAAESAAGADEADAGDTFRGMPASGRGRSRWEPPADYQVTDPRGADTVRTPVATIDPEPDTERDPEADRA